MPRIARIIAPGTPYPVTQRGNRRLQTCFCDEDYRAYIDLMAAGCHPGNVEVWAYCLMPNHIHLIALPETDEGLRRAIGAAHRRFTRRVNLREGWRGHRWQGRFASFPRDEQYLLAAARYVELNPVRAKLAADPLVWRWSSAATPLAGQDDSLVTVSPLLGRVSHGREFLLDTLDKEAIDKIRRHERTGRPLGSEVFIERLESGLERTLKRQKPGPKKKGSVP